MCGYMLGDTELQQFPASNDARGQARNPPDWLPLHHLWEYSQAFYGDLHLSGLRSVAMSKRLCD